MKGFQRPPLTKAFIPDAHAVKDIHNRADWVRKRLDLQAEYYKALRAAGHMLLGTAHVPADDLPVLRITP